MVQAEGSVAFPVQNMRIALNMARGKIGDNSEDNWALMFSQLEHWPSKLVQFHMRGGWTAPRLELMSWIRDLTPTSVPTDWAAYMDLMVAYGTDATDDLAQHIRDRLADGANIFVLMTGFTGSRKSSCAGRIMRVVRAIAGRPLKSEEVPGFFAYDQGQLVGILGRAQRGDVVVLDEELKNQGEGSRTRANNVVNVENTLRGTGVSMIVCSPTASEHAAAQVELRAFLFNPETKMTKFLLIKNGKRLGFVALRWMADPDWAYYTPFKSENLARTLRMQFQPEDMLYEAVMDRIFGNPKVVGFLSKLTKLKKNLLVAIVSNVSSRLHLTEQQQRKAIDLCVAMMEVYPRITEAEWLEVWGAPANPEFAKLANKFYQENELAVANA